VLDRQACGTPEELRRFVNESHKRGISVFFDCVLHHGAAKNNSLWCYDGWEENGNGGIYHEGGQQTGFGTSFAFWKEEVKQMLYDACALYFR
jgi:1,4-alpha-glucan branching enzyme